jgi:hypothetical protein
MKKFIEELLQKLTCCHNWEERGTYRKYEDGYSKLPWEIEKIYICKKCGKIKTIKIRTY